MTTTTTTTTTTTEQETFLREQLIPALRSGEYEQGQGYLHLVASDDGVTQKHAYCCLGVMCDLVSPESWLTDIAEETVDETRAVPFIEPEWIGVLPQHVAERFGMGVGGDYRFVDATTKSTFLYDDLDIPNHIRTGLTHHSSLVGLNDGGYAFHEIADIIEYILDHPDQVRFDHWYTE